MCILAVTLVARCEESRALDRVFSVGLPKPGIMIYL